MSAAEEKKHSKKAVVRIVSIIVIAALALFCGIKLADNVSDIVRLKAQTASAQEQCDAIKAENDSMKAIIESDDKNEYLEQKAREKGYVKAGETVYYDISSSK